MEGDRVQMEETHTGRSLARKALAIFMAFVLVFGLNPGLNRHTAWADDDSVQVMSSTSFSVNASGDGSIKITQTDGKTALVEDGATSGSCPSDYCGAALIYVTSGEIESISVSSDGSNVPISKEYLSYYPAGCYGTFNITGSVETITVKFKSDGGGSNTDPSSSLSLTLDPSVAAGSHDLKAEANQTIYMGLSATKDGNAASADDLKGNNSLKLEWFLNDSETADATDTDFLTADLTSYGGDAPKPKLGQTSHYYTVRSTGKSAGDTIKVKCKATWIVGDETAEETLEWTFTIKDSRTITVNTTPDSNNVVISVYEKGNPSNTIAKGSGNTYTLDASKTYVITAGPDSTLADQYDAADPIEWTSASSDTVNIALKTKGSAATTKPLKIRPSDGYIAFDENDVILKEGSAEGQVLTADFDSSTNRPTFQLEVGKTYYLEINREGYQKFTETFTFTEDLANAAVKVVTLIADQSEKTVTLVVKAKDSWTGESLTVDLGDNLLVELRKDSKTGTVVESEGGYDLNKFKDVVQGGTYYLKITDNRGTELYKTYEETFVVEETENATLDKMVELEPLEKTVVYTFVNDPAQSDVSFVGEYDSPDYSVVPYEAESNSEASRYQMQDNKFELVVGKSYYVKAGPETEYGAGGNADKYGNYTGETFTVNAATPDPIIQTITLPIKQYKVTFKNGGDTLSETEYAYGTAAKAIVVPATPTKEADDSYTYEFAGWDKEVADVTGAATYVAKFTKTAIVYPITYDLGNDEAAWSNEPSKTTYTVEDGEITLPVAGDITAPTAEDATFTFAGWYPDGDFAAQPQLTIAPGSKGAKSFTAAWKKTAKETETTKVKGDVTASLPSLDNVSEAAEKNRALELEVEATGTGATATASANAAIAAAADASEASEAAEVLQAAGNDVFSFKVELNVVDTTKTSGAVGYVVDELTEPEDLGNQKLALTFFTDIKYAGMKATIFQIHEDAAGQKSLLKYENSVDENGNVNVEVDRLSEFTIAIQVDKDALNAAIGSAENNKSNTVVATNAADVATGTQFVSQSDVDTLDTAINTAKTVAANTSATQAQVDDAVIALQAAIDAFNNAKQNGTKQPVAPKPTVTGVTMWRLYNPNSGEHFYTSSDAERANLVKVGWSDEAKGWTAPSAGDPVYRLYNPNEPLGDHHYTTSKAEYDRLCQIGWKGEGVGWYSDQSKGVGLHRLYNPNAYPSGKTGAHHYTTSASEKDYLVSIGWQYENYGWYGMK